MIKKRLGTPNMCRFFYIFIYTSNFRPKENVDLRKMVEFPHTHVIQIFEQSVFLPSSDFLFFCRDVDDFSTIMSPRAVPYITFEVR